MTETMMTRKYYDTMNTQRERQKKTAKITTTRWYMAYGIKRETISRVRRNSCNGGGN
jgi:hypothetical protein